MDRLENAKTKFIQELNWRLGSNDSIRPIHRFWLAEGKPLSRVVYTKVNSRRTMAFIDPVGVVWVKQKVSPPFQIGDLFSEVESLRDLANRFFRPGTRTPWRNTTLIGVRS